MQECIAGDVFWISENDVYIGSLALMMYPSGSTPTDRQAEQSNIYLIL